MEYPLYIDGEKKGWLLVTREGLYTVMEAGADSVSELTRIWVHGGGRGAYLGLMQPWSGGLYLKRRLSRRELEAFPESIEYASDKSPGAAAEPEPEPDAETLPPCAEPEPPAQSVAETEPELLWLRRPDGSLTAFDGQRNLVALPASLRSNRDGAVLRRIDGGDYLIFRY